MLSAIEEGEVDADNITAFDNSTFGLDFEETNSTE